MLSHILAFSPKDVRDTVDVCERIYHRLKDNKFKVYPDYFVAIGLLCLLDDDEDELVDDMIEMAMLLKGEKKYKWLGKGMNLLMASAIISSEFIDSHENSSVMETTLSVSIEAIIAAQQAAMIAAISASTAATTAAT